MQVGGEGVKKEGKSEEERGSFLLRVSAVVTSGGDCGVLQLLGLSTCCVSGVTVSGDAQTQQRGA